MKQSIGKKSETEMFCKCPYLTAQRLLSGKWSILILCYLRNGPLRFSELSRYMEELTQATLTKQLRKLEEDKLVLRKVYPVIPPKVEYSLSKMGEELIPVLDSLSQFGVKYINFMINSHNKIDGICEEAGTENCRCFCPNGNEKEI